MSLEALRHEHLPASRVIFIVTLKHTLYDLLNTASNISCHFYGNGFFTRNYAWETRDLLFNLTRVCTEFCVRRFLELFLTIRSINLLLSLDKKRINIFKNKITSVL